VIGFERPLSHSVLSHTACPMKRLVGLAKVKPFADAWAEVLLLSRSAIALRRVSSAGENHVKALQSSPMKMRG
jgi:hypothetical protein